MATLPEHQPDDSAIQPGLTDAANPKGKKGKAPAKQPTSVLGALSATWWLPLVRGLVGIAFGLVLLIDPLVSGARSVAYLLSIFLVVDAVMAAWQGLAAFDRRSRPWWAAQAVISMAAAILVLIWPGITPMVIYYLAAVWAFLLGVTQIITGITLQRSRNLLWSWIVANGLIATLFGLLLIARPQSSDATALRLDVVVLGVFASISGAVAIMSAFSTRFVAREIDLAVAGKSKILDGIIRERELAGQDALRRKAEQKETARQKAEKQKIEKQNSVPDDVIHPTPSAESHEDGSK